jgi:hypothetical protein
MGRSKVYKTGEYKNFAACFYEHPRFESDNDGNTGWGCANRGEWADGPFRHHNDKYSSATVQPGHVAVIYADPNFQGDKAVLEPGEHPDLGLNDRNTSIRILPNCNDWSQVWSGECDNRRDIFPNLNNTRKAFCNHNKDHAFRQECNTWCAENGGQCALRDMFNKCGKYKISDNAPTAPTGPKGQGRPLEVRGDECSDAKITDIENKCINMGFIDQTTKSSIGGAQCNQSSIDNFLKECKTFIPKYISSESGCTSIGLVDAKTRKLIDDNAEKARLQAEKDAEAGRKRQEEDTDRLVAVQRESDKKRDEELKRTSQEQIEARKAAQLQMEQTLLSVVDPDAIPESLRDRVPSKYNSTTYIILAVIILLLLSMSFFFVLFT